MAPPLGSDLGGRCAKTLQLRLLVQLALVAGLLLALIGVLTFHAPSCAGGGPTAPPSCSAWETSQWLMIAGVFLAVLAMLLLAHLRKLEAQARAAPPPVGEPSAAPAERTTDD